MLLNMQRRKLLPGHMMGVDDSRGVFLDLFLRVRIGESLRSSLVPPGQLLHRGRGFLRLGQLFALRGGRNETRGELWCR